MPEDPPRRGYRLVDARGSIFDKDNSVQITRFALNFNLVVVSACL